LEFNLFVNRIKYILSSTYGDIKKSFFTAVKKAGIINFQFHDLRHTFASQLVMAGVDLNTVRELMRHKTLEMTLRYAHLSPSHKNKAVEVLGRHLGTVWALEPKSETADRLAVSQSLENQTVTV